MKLSLDDPLNTHKYIYNQEPVDPYTDPCHATDVQTDNIDILLYRSAAGCKSERGGERRGGEGGLKRKRIENIKEEKRNRLNKATPLYFGHE